MPNVTLEHSSTFQDQKAIMQLCHDHLMESGLFKLNTIKVRCIPFEDYLVGGKDNQDFLVITVSIMPGRAKEKRINLGESLHQKIMNYCTERELSVATSVLIKETPEGLYFKNNP